MFSKLKKNKLFYLLKKTRPLYYFRKYFILPIRIFRMALVDTVRQDGIEHAGYLAFLSIFSLFPFIIFLISIVSFVGGDQIGAKVIYGVINSLPVDAAQALLPRVKEIASGPPQSFLTIAIIGIIWTASSSVEGYRTILNRAYRVHLPPPYLLRRLISILEFFILTFAIAVGIMFLVIAPSIFNIEEIKNSLSFFEQHYNDNFRFWVMFWFLAFLTSLLYYAIPNVKQKITKTIPGALLTVMLWLTTQHLFAIYLEKFHQFSVVYGRLAGIMIYLMFFYLVNLMFIFGAQFNYHFYRSYKIFLTPKKERDL